MIFFLNKLNCVIFSEWVKGESWMTQALGMQCTLLSVTCHTMLDTVFPKLSLVSHYCLLVRERPTQQTCLS